MASPDKTPLTGNPDCHYGDHDWAGTSMCVRCYARLRCSCGCYVREDNLEAHMESCLWLARQEVEEVGAGG